jgi:hypothetical protein
MCQQRVLLLAFQSSALYCYAAVDEPLVVTTDQGTADTIQLFAAGDTISHLNSRTPQLLAIVTSLQQSFSDISQLVDSVALEPETRRQPDTSSINARTNSHTETGQAKEGSPPATDEGGIHGLETKKADQSRVIEKGMVKLRLLVHAEGGYSNHGKRMEANLYCSETPAKIRSCYESFQNQLEENDAEGAEETRKECREILAALPSVQVVDLGQD